MTPLPTTFKGAYGRTYRELLREGLLRLYQVTGPGVPRDHFEVVIIREAKAHTFPDGSTAGPREEYPSDSTWGVRGWSHTGWPEAYANFKSRRAYRTLHPHRKSKCVEEGTPT